MALKTMIENLTTKKREYDEALAALGKDLGNEVASHLAPLIPLGYALGWTQYAPYFNDGDACVFSVHEPFLKRDDRESDEDDGEDEDGAEEANNEGAGPDKMELGTAMDRYGKADEPKSYETNDYSKPSLPKQPGDQPWQTRYQQRTVHYVDYGFPAIEGYSVERLQELSQAWSELPEDMLKRAFGDDCEVLIYTDGTFSNDDVSHD